jgi:hypothetical protein
VNQHGILCGSPRRSHPAATALSSLTALLSPIAFPPPERPLDEIVSLVKKLRAGRNVWRSGEGGSVGGRRNGVWWCTCARAREFSRGGQYAHPVRTSLEYAYCRASLSFIHSPTHSLFLSSTHPRTLSFYHPLTHALSLSIIHSPTLSLTHTYMHTHTHLGQVTVDVIGDVACAIHHFVCKRRRRISRHCPKPKG